MPPASVKNRKSRQSNSRPRDFAADEVTDVASVPRASPSGPNPIPSGVGENTRSARPHIVKRATVPIAVAAIGKPSELIAATQSGEKTMPPRLAPLYAMESAAGRLRANQGETIVLTAAAP